MAGSVEAGVNRPPSVLGGMDWGEFPDELFPRAEILKRRIKAEPQMKKVFPLFYELRVSENSESILYSVLAGLQNSQRYEEAQIHPDLKQIADIEKNKAAMNDKIRQARAKTEAMFDELRLQSNDPAFQEAYTALEQEFDILVNMCVPGEITDPNDRAFFNKAVFQLLTTETPTTPNPPIPTS